MSIKSIAQPSLQQAAPQTCGWFAACDRQAASTVNHPVHGDVPICDRCKTHHDAAGA